MIRYIFRRFWQGLIAVFLLTVIVFILARAAGDPVNLMLPISASEEDRQRLTEELGLDRSLPVQFVDFVGDLVRGDLGDSLQQRKPVTELYFERLPNTFLLIGAGILLAIVVALPLGVLAGANRGKPIDKIAKTIAAIGIAAPSFWVGIVLINIFAVRLGLLPAARMGGLDHYILPAFSLGFFALAAMTRLLRSSMMETLDSEFVKLALIKGVSRNMVLWRHCLKNALLPAVTFLGMYIGILIGGAVVIETVFAWPGVGRLAYEAILYRDYPVIQCVVIFNGLLIVLINFLTDITYSYIDPRIRYG